MNRRLLMPLILATAVVAVLAVGLTGSTPMVGDEVVHYYMLARQAEDLSQPNLEVHIPRAGGRVHKRFYPHVFLWHYLGAALQKPFGVTFAGTQVYQVLFWVQFLVAGWLLAKRLAADGASGSVLYLVALATVPMHLLFAVTFYQDIPATAQLLTAVALVAGGHWLAGTVFLGIGLAMKETLFVMFPAFVALTAWWGHTHRSWRRAVGRAAVSASLLLALCLPMAAGMNRAGWEYFPETMIRRVLRAAGIHARPRRVGDSGLRVPVTGPDQRPHVANHPGDLRRPVNGVMYPGVVAWVVLIAGGAALATARRRRPEDDAAPSETESLPPRPRPGAVGVMGLWYLAVVGVMMRQAPDARFFIPGLALVLLPASLALARLPRARVLVGLLALGGLLQGAGVLAKTYTLRRVPSGVEEAAAYLAQHPPVPNKVFMYPEGHYRIFSCDHTWYLDYRLQDFWRTNHVGRLGVLRENGVGAVVVKKYRVGRLDEEVENLGIYPDFFVEELRDDPLCHVLLDNRHTTIFSVPPAANDSAITPPEQP